MTSRITAGSAALAVALGTLSISAAEGAPVFMSAEWATQACDAWNHDPVLTDRLTVSQNRTPWINNDKGRGYKIIHIYRSDCAKSPRIELRIALKDGKAQCIYGGKVEHPTLDDSADYLMWATTQRWKEMGAGNYGPMKAMFLRRLRFDGPMFEAMDNMTPFGNFLLLAGKVPGDAASCPK